jgi:hypothetical protein
MCFCDDESKGMLGGEPDAAAADTPLRRLEASAACDTECPSGSQLIFF